MRSHLLPAVRATLVLASLTGLVFPLVVTLLAQVFFPHEAGGSLLKARDGRVVGSALLGQPFATPRYFHPRPSAAGAGYDATLSGGTNLGPTSRKLMRGLDDDPTTRDRDESYPGVEDLVAAYRLENGLPPTAPVPVDAVTRSASGIDPHISLANALLQASRVAAARRLPIGRVRLLVEQHCEHRDLGILGEPRVNVLKLNLALDEEKSPRQ